MTVFSDEDLKRSKESLKAAIRMTVNGKDVSPEGTFELKVMEALIARLEASEQFSEIASQQTHHCFSALGDTCKFETALKAWRRASGKSASGGEG